MPAPALTFPPDLLLAAQGVRVAFFDVDGVLTDGGLYIGQAGGQPVELKRFDIQDGLGIKLLQMAGLTVAFVSARTSEATAARARELKVDEVIQSNKKLPAFEQLLARHKLAWEDCCFVGDDLPDLPVLRRVGLPVAVANAVADVRAAAQVVTRAAGGAGAAREVAELVLRGRGVWDELLDEYFRQRGETGVDARSH